jgi:hypothetical protein
MRLFIPWIGLLVLHGCGGDPDIVCSEAAAHLAQCLGGPEAPEIGGCDPARTAAILNLSCWEISSGGKSDDLRTACFRCGKSADPEDCGRCFGDTCSFAGVEIRVGKGVFGTFAAGSSKLSSFRVAPQPHDMPTEVMVRCFADLGLRLQDNGSGQIGRIDVTTSNAMMRGSWLQVGRSTLKDARRFYGAHSTDCEEDKCYLEVPEYGVDFTVDRGTKIIEGIGIFAPQKVPQPSVDPEIYRAPDDS